MRWRSVTIAGGLIVLLAVGSTAALQQLASGLCRSTEITRLTSPDSHHDAVLFDRNCGATTDFASHVSLVPSGEPLGNSAGNVFIAEAGEAVARAAWGGPPVAVHWDTGGVLVIRYDPGAEVFQTATEVAGVPVRAGAAP
ncbi:MAG: hypothetical protein KC442_23435 [Thermomicrobiales bacterium]|nr:hypothetical protein [Thermomicrobiales bacterium]